VTEHWNAFAKIRKDLFGFIDILAIRTIPDLDALDPHERVLAIENKLRMTVGVQTTSYGNMSARVKKINESPILPILKKAGWKIVVHGWKKNSKGRWECKVTEV
jgi:hypothetical protein